MFSKQAEKRLHAVTIRVDENDTLHRVALLNTTMFKTIQGTRLVRIIEADYEEGYLCFVIEAERVKPEIAPGQVKIDVKSWNGEK